MVNVAGFATTNFDMQLPRAFNKVAEALNIEIEKEYSFAEVPQDYIYLSETNAESSKIISRLHGTLDKPWSIVAGAKANVTAITNLFYGIDFTEPSQVFDLMRQFINIADPGSQVESSNAFPPYGFLKKGLVGAARIIVIGYSFQDIELKQVILGSVQDGKELVVVDPRNLDDAIDLPTSRYRWIEATAENFLTAYVSQLENLHPAKNLKLPGDESRLLCEGPNNVPGYPNCRLSTPSEETTFLDPIYGAFEFNQEIEKDVITVVDTGEMQRLRQIKQLSFVHLKHHGATHDRFSHSLGVAILAEKLIGTNCHFARVRANRNYRTEFVIAALIHDIGHGPFGHTMDLVRRELGDAEGHEDDTGRIYDQVFAARSFADLHIALNDVTVSRNRLRDILAKRDILGLLISNDGCDIDRLDYVLRDASATIANEASTNGALKAALSLLRRDYSKIISGVFIGKDENGHQVGYQNNCREALDAFAQLYAALYNEVYYGWQNTCARAMLTRAVVEMIRSKWVGFNDIKPLTDVELMALLEEFENPKVRELAHLVKYRRLYRLIANIEIPETEERRFFSISSDEEVINEFASGVHFSPFYLMARLPSKRVVCRFADEDSENAVDELFSVRLSAPEMLASVPPRLQIFAPPRDPRKSL